MMAQRRLEFAWEEQNAAYLGRTLPTGRLARCKSFVEPALLDKPRQPAIISFWAAEAAVLITLEELQLHRISVSKTYPVGTLDYHGAEFRQVGDLKLDAVAELVGAEIRVRGHLATVVERSCDRCLGVVQIPVERDLDLFYRSMKEIAREEEIEISEDESDVAFYQEKGIELADVVSEQVILSIPMKVVCRADCEGLCPACGANRNLEPCKCPELAPEARGGSPFSSLLG